MFRQRTLPPTTSVNCLPPVGVTSHVVRPEGLEPPTSRVQSGGSVVVARGGAEHETGVGGYSRTPPDSPRLVYGVPHPNVTRRGVVYRPRQGWPTPSSEDK
jgi:hypothetical protein